jgi:hypothetical protein
MRSRPLPLALAPAFVNLPCRLALPQRPSWRESCADPLHSHRSDIRARSCTMWTGESLPHSSMRMDAQTKLSSACASSFVGTGCTSRSLPSVLFASAGVCLPWNARKSPYSSSCATGSAARLVHACEAAAATSLPARISHAYLARLVRLSTEVDGDWDGMAIQMTIG